MRIPLIYKEQSAFGCDIGSQMVKVVELAGNGSKPQLVGYGAGMFDPKLIVQGIVSDPEELSAVINKVVENPQVGKIKSRRAILSVPVSRVFIRTLHLPSIDTRDIAKAAQLEAEQYIPVPVSDLYIDFEVIKREQLPGKTATLEVQMVAAPRAIVDSYIKLFDQLGIFLEAIEMNLSSVLRAMASNTDTPTMLIDFGSESTDMIIAEGDTIRFSSTIPVGGNTLTKTLAASLGVTAQQATEIKQRFGIAPSGLQSSITEAIKDDLSTLSNEIKKAIKFYQDRSEGSKVIGQILVSGGGAHMPGLVDHLSQTIGMPITVGNPWARINLKSMTAPSPFQQAMFTTSIGLALRGVKK